MDNATTQARGNERKPKLLAIAALVSFSMILFIWDNYPVPLLVQIFGTAWSSSVNSPLAWLVLAALMVLVISLFLRDRPTSATLTLLGIAPPAYWVFCFGLIGQKSLLLATAVPFVGLAIWNIALAIRQLWNDAHGRVSVLTIGTLSAFGLITFPVGYVGPIPIGFVVLGNAFGFEGDQTAMWKAWIALAGALLLVVSLFTHGKTVRFLLCIIGIVGPAFYAKLMYTAVAEENRTFFLVTALPFLGLATWKLVAEARQLRG